MKVQQLGLCFVFLLSFHYMLGVAAQVGSSKNKVPLKKRPASSSNCCGRGGSSGGGSSCSSSGSGCMLKPSLVKKLDKAFENIRDNIPNTIHFNSTLETNLQATGNATGFKNFRVGPYSCECGGKDFVRIYVDVSFLQVLLDFVLYILESLLGGLLGPLGKALALLLGGLVEFLVKLLGINIEVQIAVVQEFLPGVPPFIESFEVADVSDIELLHLNIYFLADLLSPLLTPVVNLLMELILEGPVQAQFDKELQKLVIAKDEVIC